MYSLYNLEYEIMSQENLEKVYEIQKNTWPDAPDYENLRDKAINTKDDNCFFLIYDQNHLIGITGVDVYREYKDTIWLDYFTILPEYRRRGYGKKVLLDVINYCKSLKRYNAFRIETTYYKNRPALLLYDEVMQIKEEYTIEDTKTKKTNTIIYSYSLNGNLKPWNNKYLGLNDYYNKLKSLN